MRYWVCGLLLSLTLAGAFACSDGPADEKDENGDGGDFDDVDEAACACEETCLLAEFDCAATCTGFDSACVDDCRADYTACALACGGCIAAFNDCCAASGGDEGKLGACEDLLVGCQAQACGWEQACLDACNADADACGAACGDDWDCYAACLGETKTCYAACI